MGLFGRAARVNLLSRAEGRMCHAYALDADTAAWYVTMAGILEIFINAE